MMSTFRFSVILRVPSLTHDKILDATGAGYQVAKVELEREGCGRVDLVVLPEADPFVAVEIIRGERLYARDEYDADQIRMLPLGGHDAFFADWRNRDLR